MSHDWIALSFMLVVYLDVLLKNETETPKTFRKDIYMRFS